MIRLYDTALLCEPIDMSKAFGQIENTYFMGMHIEHFNPETATGEIHWERYSRKPRLDFGKYTLPFTATESWEFPAYTESPSFPFRLEFVDAQTVRIRLTVRKPTLEPRHSLMLTEEEIPVSQDWIIEQQDNDHVTYRSDYGSVTIMYQPWRIEFRDATGKLLTRTHHMADQASILSSDPTPFCFIRSAKDMNRSLAASFALSPGERLYGGGESFLKMDKRGQKFNWFTYDPLSAQTADMYKPIPLLWSNRGYGMFFHHSCPMTCDVGHHFDGTNTIYIGEDELDLFFFFGTPKQILSSYTSLTGKSTVPPLWSFGLWMSRITYQSEQEVREVASQLQEQRIPCDVIHLDTGWFEHDWRCDYQFSTSRFDHAEQMITDLREQGYRISLWQYPYFMPSNPLYEEIIAKGYAISDGNGYIAGEDAILDFSNPEAVAWYQQKIAGLLNIGVSAIKVDFGESAPIHGSYYSRQNGWKEHNLYPLRYNQAVSEITQKVTGESIIWARSAWAGSQRYPLHWGGDVENTDNGMAASLRAGMSLGLSGFTFWSHDIGGFVHQSPRELYRRWMPFGMLTSHSRCHGAPPKEPWHYDEEFVEDFRKAVELKYQLMPYIYTQSVVSAEQGIPLLRPLLLEYPDEPGVWQIEDQYLLGTDLLIAPMLEQGMTAREVYTPSGEWIDYQTGKRYAGSTWHHIAESIIPIIILVRAGSLIPHVPVALSTAWIDWTAVEWRHYEATDSASNKYDWQIALPVDKHYSWLTGQWIDKQITIESTLSSSENDPHSANEKKYQELIHTWTYRKMNS
ncbi:alpha-xylosidase [Paenibacillus sp. CFBP13512]|uniref:glycoside hydrolase family 31 protein n=1 Tax=Paenibacillus sp. CFBP13512 TaxID=2184007 RepID=UPI0010C13982|nr:alpha-xylosidase [Paenibacillus sp. CFBP13512]TKJ89503.1 alpha-xylosidase [Paenibacillus sp. CFBP13512]